MTGTPEQGGPIAQRLSSTHRSPTQHSLSAKYVPGTGRGLGMHAHTRHPVCSRDLGQVPLILESPRRSLQEAWTWRVPSQQVGDKP